MRVGTQRLRHRLSGNAEFLPDLIRAIPEAPADIVSALEGQGIRKLVLFNGHGGNTATIDAAFAEIYADASLSQDASNRGPVRCRRTRRGGFRGECSMGTESAAFTA